MTVWSKKEREARRLKIGSSEIGVIAGLSAYGSTLDVWATKVRGAEKAITPSMESGVDVEEPIARRYRRLTGKHLRKTGTLECASKPFWMATPDRAAFLAPSRGPVRLSEVERF